MTQKTAEEEAWGPEYGQIGCGSIEDVELPAGNSGFMTLTEGVNMIRFLQGPILSWDATQWQDGKKISETVKYTHADPEAKKNPNSRLVISYLVYHYGKVKGEGSLKVFDIKQKSIQEGIQSINSMWPDISAFDIQITKSGEGLSTKYQIVQGPPKPFDKADVIAEVRAKPLPARLKEMAKETPAVEHSEQQSIEDQIAAAGNPPTPAPAVQKTPTAAVPVSKTSVPDAEVAQEAPATAADAAAAFE